ncbi:MAG: two component transcriptional regulator, winged helix family [Acidimicrobiales bacterium]|nr:two component transcriptional regulator, winged helix family [Acidimicrobiales bacterium]
MEQAPLRVLVVDDESYITELVGTALRYEGFQVEEARSGRAAMAAATSFRPDLVVLDVMLPDLDGFDVTRRLRSEGFRAPVLFLTAKDAIEDKVAGLTIGGDDYLTKPFALDELIARVRAVLRRTRPGGEDDSLRFADLVMDEDTHEVWRGDAQVQLTPTEFKLLRYFLLNPRRVLSKTQLLEHVWEYDFGGDPNILETYISYLRKKLNAAGPPVIQTVRGVGYSLRLAG